MDPVAALLLGSFNGMLWDRERMPVKIRSVRAVTDDLGEIQAFLITTESGVQYSVHVDRVN